MMLAGAQERIVVGREPRTGLRCSRRVTARFPAVRWSASSRAVAPVTGRRATVAAALDAASGTVA